MALESGRIMAIKLSVAAASARRRRSHAGDKASVLTQSVVSVSSIAHDVFSSQCADSVRIADLVFGRTGKIVGVARIGGSACLSVLSRLQSWP